MNAGKWPSCQGPFVPQPLPCARPGQVLLSAREEVPGAGGAVVCQPAKPQGKEQGLERWLAKRRRETQATAGSALPVAHSPPGVGVFLARPPPRRARHHSPSSPHPASVAAGDSTHAVCGREIQPGKVRGPARNIRGGGRNPPASLGPRVQPRALGSCPSSPDTTLCGPRPPAPVSGRGVHTQQLMLPGR